MKSDERRAMKPFLRAVVCWLALGFAVAATSTGAKSSSLEQRASRAFHERSWQEAAELYGSLLEKANQRTEAKTKQRWAIRRGKSLLKLRRCEEALTSLTEARRYAATTGSPQPAVDSLIGWASLQLDDPSGAVLALEAARAGWERSRAADEDVLDRITLMRQHAHVDRLLQRAYLAAGDATAAYRVSERARAQGLLALLESPSLLDEETWTVERSRQLARTLSTTLVSYTVLGTEERILGDEEDDERELLIYVVSPERFAVRGVQLQGEEPTPLSDLVTALRPKILDKDEEVEVVRTALGELYDILILPVADLLPQEEGASVTFLPAGPLHLVPFAALLDRHPAEEAFLVERYALRYALAAAQLEASRRHGEGRMRSDLGHSLVVGNPLPDVPEREKLELKALPGAEREAREIAGLLGASPVLGPQAKKQALKAAMTEAPLIHFATHGLLGLDPRLDDLGRADEDAPSGRDSGVHVNPGGILMGKGVRVGGVDASVALAREKVVRVPLAGAVVLGDGFLFSGEIAGLDLNASLVVLSACDTGRGRITQEGSIGLKWAFLAARVPGVLSSLWAVPDAPTADLMIELYRHLLEGETADQALRHAMLAIQERYPHPRDWAAFGVTGIGRL